MASMEFDIEVKTKSVEEAKKRVAELTKELEKQKKELEELKNARQIDYETLRKLEEEGKKNTKTYQELQLDIKNTTTQINGLSLSVQETSRNLTQEKKSLSENEKELNNLTKGTKGATVSTKSLWRSFIEGTKATKSLKGGLQALNLVIKSNPVGAIIAAAIAVIAIIKKIFTSIQPLVELTEKVSNGFKNAFTSVVNFFGAETTEQHDARIKQLEEEKNKIDELRDSVEDLKNKNKEYERSKEKPEETKARLESNLSSLNRQLEGLEKLQKNNLSPSKRELLNVNIEGTKEQIKSVQNELDEVNQVILDNQNKKNEERLKNWQKQQEEIAKKIRAYNDRINELNYNAELDIRQREIDAMSETSAKEIAQLKLNHDKKLAEIEREKSEELSKYNEAYGTNVVSYNDLPSFVREKLDPKFIQATANSESEYNIGVERVKSKLIGEFSSFSAQLNKINAEYAKKKKEITENKDFALSESDIDVELKNITEQRNKEIDEVAKKAQTMFAKNASVWKDINKESLKDLKSRIKDLKVLKSLYESKDRDEIEKLSQQLNLTEEQKEAIEAVKQSSNETTEAIETLNKEIKTGIESEIEMLNDYVSVVQGLIDNLSDLASKSNSTKGEGISNGLNAMSNGINGFYKGQSTLASLQSVGLFSNMSAAAGGAIGIVVAGLTMIYENTMRVKQRNEEIKKSYKDIAEAIKETKKEQELLTKQAENNTIFGNSKTSYRQAAEDLELYKKNLSDIVSEYEKYSQSVRRGNFDDSAYRATLSDGELMNLHLGAINRNIGQGELIKDGKFNVEVARDILEYETNLTDEARNYLTELINVFGGIEESERAMKEDLQSVFGSLGDTLANDLINAFSEGTDAGEAMAKSIKSMFLAETQKNISAEISSVYSKYSGELSNAIATETYEDDSALMDKMNSEINGIVERYKNEVEWIRNLSGNNDISSSSSSAKGIAQASQDSVNELNGRFTAIQSHTYQMNENLRDMHARQATILEQIMGIHNDTSSMARDIRTISTSGVQIKR